MSLYELADYLAKQVAEKCAAAGIDPLSITDLGALELLQERCKRMPNGDSIRWVYDENGHRALEFRTAWVRLIGR